MTVSELERGVNTNYRRGTIDRLARALRTTPEYLIQLPPLTGSSVREDEGENLTDQLLVLWKTVRPEHRKAVLAVLQIVVRLSVEGQRSG